MKLQLLFAWYDLWIGLFYDKKKRWIYLFPIPMFGLVIKLREVKKLNISDVSTSLDCGGCIYATGCNTDKQTRCEDYLS